MSNAQTIDVLAVRGEERHLRDRRGGGEGGVVNAKTVVHQRDVAVYRRHALLRHYRSVIRQ